jgi:uncharacterized membrane protein YoaK (UPF0700 family)
MDENSVSHASAPEASSPLVMALFGLTFVTGIIDAVSFLGLGHVFTANMTGNVVLLGFALGGTADLSVGRSLAALCAFAIGGVLGGRLTIEHQRTPARQLLIAMHVEVLLVCLAAAAALIGGGDTSFARLSPVIVLTAVAMGLRNAVVRKLAVPDLTTTVLTLTVTGLAADSVLAGGVAPRTGRRILSVLAMGSGALVGTMLVRPFGMWAPLAVAAFMVAGLAMYLYLSEPSGKREDCARVPPPRGLHAFETVLETHPSAVGPLRHRKTASLARQMLDLPPYFVEQHGHADIPCERYQHQGQEEKRNERP